MLTAIPCNRHPLNMINHVIQRLAKAMIGALWATLLAGVVVAEETASLLQYAAIHASLERINPQIKAESIESTRIDGIARVVVNSGDTLYMTLDGEHFFAGTLFSNEVGKGLVNVTENNQKQARAVLLNNEVAKHAWVFPAKSPKKASITVFTDVDCYYCQKLHAEIADITALGIEVRYLAFPRAGLGSSSHQILVDAWCADDQNAFMTEAKLRSHNKMAPQASPADCKNPVAGHYALSQQMSLQGTPAILLDDGTLWPGYLPAATIAQRLNIN